MRSGENREQWMTPELEEKLLLLAENKCLSCTEIQQFAREHGLQIYAYVDHGDYEDVRGVGEMNLVARFQKRFDGVSFPGKWLKHRLRNTPAT